MTAGDGTLDPFDAFREDVDVRATGRGSGLRTGGAADGERSVAVVGGAMAGLAAAHAFSRLDWDVELYERQSFDEKRVNCGEAMTDVTRIPLEKTPENGFANDTPIFEVQVFTGDVDDRELAGTGRFPASRAYVTDRALVERAWAARLREDGVDVRENTGVSKADFDALCERHDLVVDATGQPSLASKIEGTTAEYAGAMTALNADVEGDFSDLYPDSRIVFENYLGYSWVFPKSESRANVGIGWAQDRQPESYMAAFEAACERNDWPVPTREQANVYTIPRGPSLDPERTWLPDRGVVRVGDAAGIANRFTGKGISQAIESSYLAAVHADADVLEAYPDALYARLRDEYRLAYVVRGALEDGRPDILSGVMEAVSGIDVEDVDRNPRKAFARLARHPVLVANMLGSKPMLQRAWRAWTNDWEFRHLEDASAR
ncbi:NAD(P)/FAD-dependent oxidoreductase [Halorubellus salinus]|uniref:NAD(P)/FAD-dependent oxidoreductase n=1 Tax=Halorubellus salinus TaxID=755309 RepID=UPI001D08B6ED|nr:NAD(P)/FAD-dependent oxidoreductase [Halorubellus salinus]